MVPTTSARQPTGLATAPGQIFVLGRNRSGTKWLTNQIANHPAVAAITAPETGALEANIFEHLPKMFGDLAINDNYYAFLAAFMKSSYFHRSGLPESALFGLRHNGYLELFAFLMDRLAAERGREYWLQKGSSLMLPELKRVFPGAKYLIMRRTNVLDNVRSSIALKGANSAKRNKPLLVAREISSYYLHRGVEQVHLVQPNVHLVNYEAMKVDKVGVMRAVCEFIGLEYDPVVLEDAFPPNTSYKRKKRDDVLTHADRRAFEIMRPVIGALPLPLLRRLYHGRVRRAPRKGEKLLISGAFKSFRREVEARYPQTAEDSGGSPKAPLES